MWVFQRKYIVERAAIAKPLRPLRVAETLNWRGCVVLDESLEVAMHEMRQWRPGDLIPKMSYISILVRVFVRGKPGIVCKRLRGTLAHTYSVKALPAVGTNDVCSVC